MRGFLTLTGPEAKMLTDAMQKVGMQVPFEGLNTMQEAENEHFASLCPRDQKRGVPMAIKDIEFPDDVMQVVMEAEEACDNMNAKLDSTICVYNVYIEYTTPI